MSDPRTRGYFSYTLGTVQSPENDPFKELGAEHKILSDEDGEYPAMVFHGIEDFCREGKRKILILWRGMVNIIDKDTFPKTNKWEELVKNLEQISCELDIDDVLWEIIHSNDLMGILYDESEKNGFSREIIYKFLTITSLGWRYVSDSKY